MVHSSLAHRCLFSLQRQGLATELATLFDRVLKTVASEKELATELATLFDRVLKTVASEKELATELATLFDRVLETVASVGERACAQPCEAQPKARWSSSLTLRSLR